MALACWDDVRWCGGVFRDESGTWSFGLVRNLGSSIVLMTELWGIFICLGRLCGDPSLYDLGGVHKSIRLMLNRRWLASSSVPWV